MGKPSLRVIEDRPRWSPSDASVAAVEKQLLGGLLLCPAGLPAVRSVLTYADFLNPNHGAIYRVMSEIADAGAIPNTRSLHCELDAEGSIDAMRLAFGLADDLPTGAWVEGDAKIVKRAALERESKGYRERLARDRTDAEALSGIEEVNAQIDELEHATSSGVEEILFTGERLLEIVNQPEPPSPLPGILDPDPNLHLLVGKPKSGKTTFALAIARAWALGESPWPGAPPLPGGRALVLSAEQQTVRIVRTLRRLNEHCQKGARGNWHERMGVLGLGAGLSTEARKLHTLDDHGLAVLRGILRRAEEDGNPFTFILLDSLSRLKPRGVEEIDADGMNPWLDQLARLSVEFSSYVTLIHHAGHTMAPDRQEARSASRGSSAISGVAQVAMLLGRTDSPRFRRLKVEGNAIVTHELEFRVAADEHDEGLILFFEPGRFEKVSPEDLPDEWIPKTRLAWMVEGREPVTGKVPGGEAQKTAGRLIGAWEREGRIEIERSGKRVKIRPKRESLC